MTLEEAIKHAEEKANELYDSEIYFDLYGNERMDFECHKCATEHEQLAKWLKELKRVRNDRVLDELCRLRSDLRSGDIVGCTLRTSAQMKCYIKALDEIIEIARSET